MPYISDSITRLLLTIIEEAWNKDICSNLLNLFLIEGFGVCLNLLSRSIIDIHRLCPCVVLNIYHVATCLAGRFSIFGGIVARNLLAVKGIVGIGSHPFYLFFRFY